MVLYMWKSDSVVFRYHVFNLQCTGSLPSVHFSVTFCMRLRDLIFFLSRLYDPVSSFKSCNLCGRFCKQFYMSFDSLVVARMIQEKRVHLAIFNAVIGQMRNFWGLLRTSFYVS